MQLIIDGSGLRTGSNLRLFVEGTQSDIVNIYCRGHIEACDHMEIHALAPNLNINIYCQYNTACYNMFISGKLYLYSPSIFCCIHFSIFLLVVIA